MELCCFGLNHKTAPLEVRERYAFKPDELESALLELSSVPGIEECMILSTCNRTEVYFTTQKGNLFEEVFEFLKNFKGTSNGDEKYFYRKRNEEAVSHGFAVASGIDSLVVGEPQIVGQFKDAYTVAKECGTVGTVLSRFCETALNVSKKVRNQTGIGKHPVSVSSVAVELAKKIFGDLNGKTVTIVGAGEMAELAVRHLVGSGASNVIVVNRTLSRAEELAKKFGGKAYSFDRLKEAIKESEIVISSTGASGYVITEELVKEIVENRETPIFFIDIAVPRDVDPSVSKFSNAYVYYIDDLESIVQANLKERLSKAEQAMEIVEKEAKRFTAWMRELEIAPLIAQLKQRAEEIRRSEIEKRLSSLNLTEEQREEVENLTRVIINKLLHQPITAVKKKGIYESKPQIVEVFLELFGLEKNQTGSKK
jgi:glutamyl-tRNA reductase